MNKRRLTFEITVDDRGTMGQHTLNHEVMSAVFNGLAMVKLPYEVRVVLLESKSIVEGTLVNGEAK